MMTTFHKQMDWRFWRNWGLAFLGFPLGGLAALDVAGGIETAWDGVLGGLASGAVIGGAQWLVLRQHEVRSGVWVPTVALAWALGWAVTRAAGVDLAPNFANFGSTGAWRSNW
jgi:hypothetical protein